MHKYNKQGPPQLINSFMDEFLRNLCFLKFKFFEGRGAEPKMREMIFRVIGIRLLGEIVNDFDFLSAMPGQLDDDVNKFYNLLKYFFRTYCR